MNEPPAAVGGSGQASTVAKKNHPTHNLLNPAIQFLDHEVLDRVIQNTRSSIQDAIEDGDGKDTTHLQKQTGDADREKDETNG